MPIVKVYNLKKPSNRLVGFFSVGKNDFQRVVNGGKVTEIPSENFYRKFRQSTGKKWDNDYGWKTMSEDEVLITIEVYKNKMKFYERQLNTINTLATKENINVSGRSNEQKRPSIRKSDFK